MFRNRMPRYEVLSEDAMATLDKGWRRLVTELGVEFMSQRALDLLAAEGQEVEGNNVKFDPDWILAQVAKAPREFDLQARNPEHDIHIGGDECPRTEWRASADARQLARRRGLAGPDQLQRWFTA